MDDKKGGKKERGSTQRDRKNGANKDGEKKGHRALFLLSKTKRERTLEKKGEETERKGETEEIEKRGREKEKKTIKKRIAFSSF